ncbi:MAG: ribonuclease J [Boseongicola sp. SB0675_bin_26]|nr:ribonuclease J [Boseongicola sp. SB0675_bin_26]
MTKDRLFYLPLGGADEVGMNTYVYGYGPPDRERLIVVDMGVAFPDMESTPGVDLIFADVSWLAERADRIDAIFITHGHEDHIGALGHLWPQLRATVFTRAFTGHLARRKFEERGLDAKIVNVVQSWPKAVKAGPFRVGFAPVSHSIPESSALIIDTPAGRIVHTGDFKLDATPVVGEAFDEAFWRGIGDQGVHVLTCDSTNVFSPLPGRSEASIEAEIRKLAANASGMIAATTFASNVARLQTLASAGAAAGRSVCLLGRAMRQMVEASVTIGILTDFPKTISPDEAKTVPRERLMLLVTGSQGEGRAASAALSRGRYLGLELSEGDTFLFSSKTIPGNERAVLRVVNALAKKGVDVIEDTSILYHVSGHANRPDLDRMHEMLRPGIVVPMHGECRHLKEHARVAARNGFASLVAGNGSLVDLTGTVPKVTDHVEAGRIYLDGKVQVGALDGVIRNRTRMAMNGHVAVTLFLEGDESDGGPWADLTGLPGTGVSGKPLGEVLETELDRQLERSMVLGASEDEEFDDRLADELRSVVRKACDTEVGKKPEVTVLISRSN